MNNPVGLIRSIIAAVMLLANVVILSGAYLFLQPSLDNKRHLLSSTRSELSKVRQNLNSVLDDFENLEGQEVGYQRLEDRQFFHPELMVQSQKIFEDAQDFASIRTSISLSSTREIKYERLARIGWKMIKQDVKVNITALDDADIYRYVDYLNKKLPGYIKLRSFNIRKKRDFGMPLLEKIMQGGSPDSVSAELLFDWYFMLGSNNQQGKK